MSKPLVTMDAIRWASAGRPVLRDVSFALQRGEWATLLDTGPASGAPSLALVLAGFIRPHGGRILMGGEDVTRLPPHRRGLGVVHRELGLFPRLTVAQALASSGARPSDIAVMQGAMQLDDLRHRLPAQLSPDQAIRLAIARSLVRHPSLLLLDDPWSGPGGALDLPAIEAILTLVQGARAMLGFTVLHVTRQLDLAWSMPARLLALIDGQLRQDGSAVALYNAPADLAVARLLGEMNALPGRVSRIDDGMALVQLDFGALVEARAADGLGLGPCRVAIRPERLAIAAASVAELGEGAFAARIEAVQFRGDRLRLRLSAGAAERRWTTVIAIRPAAVALPGGAQLGAEVAVAWQPDDAVAFSATPGGSVNAPSNQPTVTVLPPLAQLPPPVAPPGARGYPVAVRDDPPASSRVQDQPT